MFHALMPDKTSLFNWPIKPLRSDISMFWQNFMEGAMTTKLLENCGHPQRSLRGQVSDCSVTDIFWNLLLPRAISGPKPS